MNEREMDKKGVGAEAKSGISRANIGNTGNDKLDFQAEFRQSFSKGLYYSKMAETSLAFLDRMNPAKEILPEIKNLDDTQQKDIKESLSADMQEWLTMYRAVLEEGKTLPVDIIGMASDLARQDRERLKKR